MVKSRFSSEEVLKLMNRSVRAKASPMIQGVVRASGQWCGDHEVDGYMLLVDWNNQTRSAVERQDLLL